MMNLNFKKTFAHRNPELVQDDLCVMQKKKTNRVILHY